MPPFENVWAVAHEAIPALFSMWSAECRVPASRSLGDAVASGSEQIAQTAGKSGFAGFASVPPSERGNDAAYALTEGVAVIRVRGPLDRETAVSGWTGKRLSTGYGDIRSAVETAAADPSASAVLLAMDSPGGAVGGCKELADAIAAVSRRKPCAAYADGLCASAAYWLASATGRVFAPITAQVGSIGVVMIHADFSRLNEKMGVSYSYITGGEWKAVGNEDAPLSPESRAYLQQRVNALHAIFRADVARNMGLSLGPAGRASARDSAGGASAELSTRMGGEAVPVGEETEPYGYRTQSVSADMEGDAAAGKDARAWGDGQIFLAQEAQRLGLVSAIVTGMDEAIHILAQETHMDKATLAAQHPGLLAQIEAEAKEVAAKEAAALRQQAEAQARADTLALVRTLIGEDAGAKVESVLKAGVSPDQLAALAPLFAAKAPDKEPPAPSDASTRAALLAALEKATMGALPDAAVKAGDASEAKAAIDRLANMEV